MKEITGEVSGGSMTAILGPSESGKSSFLRLVSGVKTAGKMTGQILVSPSRDDKVTVSFVSKDDSLDDTLTVEELLLYTSRITCRVDTVSGIIDSLKLHSVLKERVSKLSTKNKQILRLAKSLVSKPDILALDEITSGMDENSSLIMMSKLKEFSSEDNAIVLVSFTNPSFEMVHHNFQRMICLSSLGSVIYSGSAEDLEESLHEISLGNSRVDPIDFLLEISSGMHGNHVIERMARKDSLVLTGESSGHNFLEVVRSKPVASLSEQLFFLFLREFRSTFCRRIFSLLLLLHFIFAIFIGLENDGSCSSVEKSSNLIVTFIQLTNICLGLQVESRLRRMKEEVERENWFSVSCYFTARSFVDLFLAVILTFITSLILLADSIGSQFTLSGYIYSLLLSLSLAYSSSTSLIVHAIQSIHPTISLLLPFLFHVLTINCFSTKIVKNLSNNLKILANCPVRTSTETPFLPILSFIAIFSRITTLLLMTANRETLVRSFECCTKVLRNIYNRIYHELYVFFNPNSDERLRYDVTQRDARIV